MREVLTMRRLRRMPLPPELDEVIQSRILGYIGRNRLDETIRRHPGYTKAFVRLHGIVKQDVRNSDRLKILLLLGLTADQILDIITRPNTSWERSELMVYQICHKWPPKGWHLLPLPTEI